VTNAVGLLSGASVTKQKNYLTCNLRSKSNYVTLINASILKAMEVVPRHLFMEAALIHGKTTKEKMKFVYNYKKPMKATQWSQESAAEVIGVQVQIKNTNTRYKISLSARL
jgi:hypothetical protein